MNNVAVASANTLVSQPTRKKGGAEPTGTLRTRFRPLIFCVGFEHLPEPSVIFEVKPPIVGSA